MLWIRLTGELGMKWADEFLRRSKNAYLHIDDEDFGMDMARISMHQLLPTCHTRLASLHLDHLNALYESYALPQLFTTAISYTFESLTDLSITYWSRPDDDALPHLKSLFTRTPRICSLRQLSTSPHTIKCAPTCINPL